MIVELRGGQTDPFPQETQNPGLWRTSAGGAERFNQDVQREGGFLGDNSDGTYVHQTGVGLFGAFRLFFPDYAIPDNAQVRSVQMKVRARAATPNIILETQMITIGTIFSLRDNFTLSAGTTEFLGTVRTDPNSGRPWGQSEVDLILAVIGTQEPDTEDPVSTEAVVTEVSYLLDVNMAPTLTVTGPSGSVSNTSRPVVTWTYSDAESDAQERYRVRVFSRAQFESPGFDPRTSKAFWDSGLVFSGAVSAQTGLLPNGDYRAYVVVGDVGSSGRLTYWGAHTAWTQSFPAPGIPIVTVSPEPATARVRLELLETVGAASTTSFVVQRSMDGGAYEDVLEVANTAPTAEVAYDYAAPREAFLSYRAYAKHLTTDETSVSAPGAAVPTELDSDGQFWLKSLSDPSLNTPVDIATHELESVRPEHQNVFRAWGRPAPIVMSTGVKSESFSSIPFCFTTDAPFEAVEGLRHRKETLLLQSCYGDGPLQQWFIRLGEIRSTTRVSTSVGIQIRQVSIDAVEVA